MTPAGTETDLIAQLRAHQDRLSDLLRAIERRDLPRDALRSELARECDRLRSLRRTIERRKT